MCQADVIKTAKGLEKGGTRELQGGYHFQLYQVAPGGEKSVAFGPLGYASAAISSYQVFKKMRTEGKISTGTRFQVSLPTPIAVVMSFCEPASIQAIWPAYEARLKQEISEILEQSRLGTLPSNGTSRPRFVSFWKIQKWPT